MVQKMTPGRRRALTVKIAKAQMVHLVHLTTPEGGETRQQRRMRERSAAKTLLKMKDKSRHGSKEKDSGEKEGRPSVIEAPRKEGDQG